MDPSGRKRGMAVLFRKSIEPRCAYCQRGGTLEHDAVICAKKGIVSCDFHCRHFVYDPLRRQPVSPAAPDFSRLEDEDFIL